MTKIYGKLSPRKMKAIDRRAKAMQMRLRGYNFAEIAEENDCSASMARKDVLAAYKMALDQTADMAIELRMRELVSMDRLEIGLWKLATGETPHLGSIDMILKIKARRAKLMGLDMPPQLDVNVNVSITVEGARNELQRRLSPKLIPGNVVENDSAA